MSAEIEMSDLPHSRMKTPEDPSSTPNIPSSDADDQVVAFWAWTSSAMLLSIAVPLILFPQFILFLAETSGTERRTLLTPLESFLALHTGILLVAVALALVFNVPSAPILASVTQHSNRGHPLLAPLSGACLLIAFISYNTKSVGSLAFILFLGSATVGAWGLWSILFAGSSYRSRKTGADKRTSRFLFGNKAAASVQKKQWKEKQAKSS